MVLVTVAGLEVLGEPAIEDNRFLASATAPELTVGGLATGADLVVAVAVGAWAAGLVVVLEDNGALTTGFGLDELTEVAGFLVVVVEALADAPPALFSAKVSVFPGEWLDPVGAREVLLVVVVVVFFFSSPEPPIEGVDLCPALDDVGAVALLGAFRRRGARVGGFDRPPVVVRVDATPGLAEDVVDEVEGRFAAVVKPFLGRAFSFLTPLAAFGASVFSTSFSVSVSISDVMPVVVVSSPERISAGASSCWGTSGAGGASTSAMAAIMVRQGLNEDVAWGFPNRQAVEEEEIFVSLVFVSKGSGLKLGPQCPRTVGRV
jgi:hypothetical protein